MDLTPIFFVLGLLKLFSFVLFLIFRLSSRIANNSIRECFECAGILLAIFILLYTITYIPHLGNYKYVSINDY